MGSNRISAIRPKAAREPLTPAASWLVRARQATLSQLALLLLRPICRIKVDGAAFVPRQGGVILVGNHVNPFEAPLIAGLLRRSDLCVVASDHLRRRPALRWILERAYHVFWVNRMAGREDLVAGIPPLLRSGHIVVITPEGRYSWNGRLGTGEIGPALVALNTGMPILPVATAGLEALSSSVRPFRRPSVLVRFGPPFRFPANPDANTDEITAAADTIMLAIARLLPPEKRGSWAERADKFDP